MSIGYRKNWVLAFISIVLLIIVFGFNTAYAQDDEGLVTCTGLDCDLCAFFEMIQNIVNFAIRMSFILGAAIIVVGGLVMLLAGAADGVTRGKKIITTAVIGILIILGSWLVVNFAIYLIVPEETRKEGSGLLSWYDVDCEAIQEKILLMPGSIDLSGASITGSGSARDVITGGVQLSTGEVLEAGDVTYTYDPSKPATEQQIEVTYTDEEGNQVTGITSPNSDSIILENEEGETEEVPLDQMPSEDPNQELLEWQESLVGAKYVSGGQSEEAVDCSGAIMYGLWEMGYDQPDMTADGIYKNITTNKRGGDSAVNTSGLNEGDLIFYDYNSDGKIDHVATYAGNDEMIHPSSGSGVVKKVSTDYLDGYTQDRGGKIYYGSIDYENLPR